jgi:PAS domain S-box-containing protein
MRRWLGEQGLRWEINAAARRWALDRGVVEADWRALADELGERGRVSVGRGGWPLWRVELTLADGTLWWLGTEDPEGAPRATVSELLQLTQEFGRMGVFERDLRTGRGYWGPQVFGIYGIDPAHGVPLFDEGLAYVHPDDRALFLPEHRAVAGGTGRHALRFRIVRPDGQVRHLHSLSEVRNGADGHPATMVGVLIDDTESVERERAQREASEQLGNALAMAGVSVWHVDTSTQRLYHDERSVRHVGVPEGREGFPVDAVREWIHPDDRAASARAAEEALHGNAAVDVMVRYRATNTWRTLLTRRVARRNESGEATGLLGVSLDVTDLVAHREQSQVLQQRTQALSAALGLGLWSRNEDSGAAQWNEPMYALYGRERHEGPPSPDEWLARYVHPLDRERMQRRPIALDDTPLPNDHHEFRIVRGDGQTRWIYAWSRCESRDGQRVTYGVNLDATERRSAELELRRERERARFAMEAAGVGIWEMPLDGRPLYWSPQMYHLRGYEPDDGRSLLELGRLNTDPKDQQFIEQMMKRHIELGEPYEHEFRVRWPDGTYRWVATRGHVVRDGEGRPLGVTGINMDITERKKAQSLWLDKQRVEQSSRAKSEFMARMSHELRTPMNAVLGFTQLLAQDATQHPTPRQRERLQHIEAAGRHLLALIDDVLDLASIEADDRPPARESVALGDVARDALQWVGALAQRHGVTLRQEPAALPGRVLADRRRLGQIVVNLLTNAVKYNRSDGWVEVRARQRLTDEGHAQWGLVVRDNGRGLTSVQLERVFEPFDRLGAEHEGIPGTGIGLTIVRQLAERMGGSVEVLSQTGVGSEFLVWLPAADEPSVQPLVGPLAPALATPLEHDDAVAADLTLLCIEDNVVNMTLVREVVSLRPSVKFLSSDTGAAGLQIALRERPDVVLLDLQLPDLHGLEVLRRLRADERGAGITVIALSANAMPEDVRAALAAGFDDYWTKPIDFTRFLSGLDALAKRTRVA